MKHWLFIIEVKEDTIAFTVKASSQDAAIKRAHSYLRSLCGAFPDETWSPNWEDLRNDIVEYGGQSLYGPFDDIPALT